MAWTGPALTMWGELAENRRGDKAQPALARKTYRGLGDAEGRGLRGRDRCGLCFGSCAMMRSLSRRCSRVLAAAGADERRALAVGWGWGPRP
jgi:hypothetical protein